MTACPKCNFELEDGASECPACGIVIAKYLAYSTGPVPTVPPGPTVPSEPTVSSGPRVPEPEAPLPESSEPPSTGLAKPSGLDLANPSGIELAEPPPAAPTSSPAETFPGAPSQSNPYAPPAAAVALPEAVPGELSATDERITELTVQSLRRVRPWLKFLVIYGWGMIGFIFIGAIGILVAAPGGGTEGFLFFLIYVLYAVLGLALILPLSKSAQALKGLGVSRTSDAIEGFAVHQANFWRRSGIISAIGLILMGLLLLLVLLGVGASLLG